MEIQFQFSSNSPALEIGEDSLLDAGPGEQEIFLGLNLRLRQGGRWLFIQRIRAMVDGKGGWSAAPGFRNRPSQRFGVLHRGKEELTFGIVRALAHGWTWRSVIDISKSIADTLWPIATQIPFLAPRYAQVCSHLLITV